MKLRYFRKVVSFIATFAVLINSIGAPLSILAQTVEESPTPEATIIAAAEESTQTPEATQTEIASPTPEVTPAATEAATPQPATPQPETQNTTNESAQTLAPPTESPTINPTSIPEPPKKEGTIATTVVENIDLSAINLLNSNVDTGTVTTDKPDYSPTGMVLITGTGFTAEKTYTIEISSTDEPPVVHSDSVTADSQGTFTYSYQLDGNYRPNYKIEVKSGEVVVASTTFTDSRNFGSILVNGGLSTTVTQNGNVTVEITISTTGSSEDNDWESTRYTIEGQGSFCINTNDHTTSGGPFSESFDVSAPSTNGTYDLTIVAFSEDSSGTGNCTGQSSSQPLQDAITVVSNGRTTSSATLNALPNVTVSPGATITTAVTGTIANGYDWHSTGWRISTSTGSYTCVNTNDHDSNGTFTETFNTTAPTSPGIYNAYFRISGSNSNCSNETGTVLTLTGKVVVSNPDSTPPTVNAGSDQLKRGVFTQVGSASDASGIANVSWTKQSGPGSIAFGSANSTTTTISANTSGTYVIRLTATDNATNSSYDEFTLIWDTVAPTQVSKTIFSGWYNSNQTSTFVYSDSNGIASGIPVTCIISTEGSNRTCSVTPNVCDNAGNCNTTLAVSNGANIDKTAPTGTIGYSTTSWTSGDVLATLTPSENITVTNNGGSLTKNFFANGSFIFTFTDQAGNTGTATATVNNIDKSAPVTTDSGTDSNWRNTDVTVSLNCNDGSGSGCDVIYFTTDGSTPTSSHYNGTGSSVFLSSDGIYTIKFYGVDQAGNVESVKTAANTVKVDKTGPIASLLVTEGVLGPDNWYTGDVTVRTICSDFVSLIAAYSSDQYQTTDTTGQTFNGWCENNAGLVTNAEPLIIKLDKTDPDGEWVSPKDLSTVSGVVALEYNATDETSDVAETVFSFKPEGSDDGQFEEIDGSSWDTTSLLLGNYVLMAQTWDNAGNMYENRITVGVAAVISGESSNTFSTYGATVSWITDRPTMSRVVYDTVQHPTPDLTDPNFGYAYSTGTSDVDPKVYTHLVTITGLADGTLYYYRVVSAGSPTAIGSESGFKTYGSTGAPGSTGGSVVLGVSTSAGSWPKLAYAGTNDSVATNDVLGAETKDTGTSGATVATDQSEEFNFVTWVMGHKKISFGVILVLIAIGFYLKSRKK